MGLPRTVLESHTGSRFSLLADPSLWPWEWIERVTWIIAIPAGLPGLPYTILQVRALRAEQQRFTREVTEKPDL